jgi:hypothetical protein
MNLGKLELGKIVIMMPDLYQTYEERGKDWTELAEKVWQIQQARKEYERIEGILIAQLREMSKGVSSKGGSFVFTSIMRKGAVDYNLIPYLKSIDLEQYRKSSIQSWSLKQI